MAGNSLLERISNKIVLRWIKKGAIEKENQEWFAYGTFSLISGIINLCIFILVGLILGKVIATVIFMLFFVLNREFMGGYHSSTVLSCKITSLLILLAVIIMSDKYIIINNVVYINLINFFAGNLVIYLLCPVQHHNKIMDLPKRKNLKKVSFLVYNLSFIAGIVLYVLKYNIVATISLTMTAVWILAILGYYKERRYIQ